MRKMIVFYSVIFIFLSVPTHAGEIIDAIGKTIDAASYLNLKPRNVLIKGTIRAVDGLSEYPVKMQEIQLLSEEKPIYKTTSSLLGEYQFFVKISDGKYSLVAQLKGFKCSKDILVSKSKNENIDVICSKVN